MRSVSKKSERGKVLVLKSTGSQSMSFPYFCSLSHLCALCTSIRLVRVHSLPLFFVYTFTFVCVTPFMEQI